MADIQPEKRDTDFTAFQSPHEASVNRLIESLDRAYHRPWLMMWRAFLQGLMSAFGMTFGYLLIFTLLAYVFQSLGGIKLLDPLIERVTQSVIPASLRQPTTTSDSPASSSTPGVYVLTADQLRQLETQAGLK